VDVFGSESESFPLDSVTGLSVNKVNFSNISGMASVLELSWRYKSKGSLS